MVQISASLDRLECLKQAELAMYFHIEEMFRNGNFTEQEGELVWRLIDIGKRQLEAACNWYEYDLMRAPYEVHYLEGVNQRWDQIPPSERPTASREAVASRLINLREEIRKKEAQVESDKEGGYFWSIVPLLEFFDLPEEERAGKSCYPLLPFFMQEAYKQMQASKQRKPGMVAQWIGRVKRLRLRVTVQT